VSPPRPTRRSGERGFTLIELMIALACAGILTASLLATRSARHKVLGAATQERRATAALEAELERLRSLPKLPQSGRFESPTVARLREAQATRTVSALPTGGLARVELALRWTDARERKRQVKLVSLLAERSR
jgi:prepilin-type N-terminal cleavage/methylation domain-containing protein